MNIFICTTYCYYSKYINFQSYISAVLWGRNMADYLVKVRNYQIDFGRTKPTTLYIPCSTLRPVPAWPPTQLSTSQSIAECYQRLGHFHLLLTYYCKDKTSHAQQVRKPHSSSHLRLDTSYPHNITGCMITFSLMRIIYANSYQHNKLDLCIKVKFYYGNLKWCVVSDAYY